MISIKHVFLINESGYDASKLSRSELLTWKAVQRAPQFTARLSSFPWKTRETESRYAYGDDLPDQVADLPDGDPRLEKYFTNGTRSVKEIKMKGIKNIILVRLTCGRAGNMIPDRFERGSKGDGVLVDLEIDMPFADVAADPDLLYHVERYFPPSDTAQAQADAFLGKVKHYVDSKTLQELSQEMRTGRFAMSKFGG